jgi:hypothetical protein
MRKGVEFVGHLDPLDALFRHGMDETRKLVEVMLAVKSQISGLQDVVERCPRFGSFGKRGIECPGRTGDGPVSWFLIRSILDLSTPGFHVVHLGMLSPSRDDAKPAPAGFTKVPLVPRLLSARQGIVDVGDGTYVLVVWERGG